MPRPRSRTHPRRGGGRRRSGSGRSAGSPRLSADRREDRGREDKGDEDSATLSVHHFEAYSLRQGFPQWHSITADRMEAPDGRKVFEGTCKNLSGVSARCEEGVNGYSAPNLRRGAPPTGPEGALNDRYPGGSAVLNAFHSSAASRARP